MNWGREAENSIKGEHGYIVARFRTAEGVKFIPYHGSRMLTRVALSTAREAMDVCENHYQITGGAEDS